jgi:protein O-GlcNAc transferase
MPEFTIPQSLQIAIQHHQAGRLPQAEALYREIVALDPRCVDAWHNLGVIALQAGQPATAADLIRRALALAPNHPAIHASLGQASRHLHHLDEAIACFQNALALQPDFAGAHSNLGSALLAQGRLEPALACFKKAVALNPNSAEAHSDLGSFFGNCGQLDQALASYRRALALKPDFADVHHNIGSVHKERGHFDDALPSYQRAITLRPDFADAHNNLGRLFVERGELEEALACYRRALALAPARSAFHSNIIFTLQYREGDNADAIDAELRRWNHDHGRPLAGLTEPYANDRSPGRPLRIGYVSHDFRLHAVAFFLLPLLESHDRANVHVTCYSTNFRSDDVTTRIRSCAAEWHSLVGVTCEQAARRIRADRIDILIDLSGHTAGDWLPLFAQKPAPVQVSYLGYPGTTGLAAIDFRLTDEWVDPLGANAEYYSEQLVRLPGTAWCFTPLSGSPPVSALPATHHGHVTFGCFNNFIKITDAMQQVWSRILLRVPGSRLALKNQAVSTPSIAQRIRMQFATLGISGERLVLVPHQTSTVDHLRCFDRVDLALDTFPYHGTTTTCEALWMGVPVITLAGHRHVSRVGASLLTSVGLTEFVTHNPDAYVEAAVVAARDLPRLAALRAGLRERMQRSPLMDGPRLARGIEAAYRTMWRGWCERSIPSQSP